MVSFWHGRPDRAQYRRFKMKSVTRQDDFACMAETVRRRYSRLLREIRDPERPPPNPSDDGGDEGGQPRRNFNAPPTTSAAPSTTARSATTPMPPPPRPSPIARPPRSPAHRPTPGPGSEDRP
jgi:hypothetical protein